MNQRDIYGIVRTLGNYIRRKLTKPQRIQTYWKVYKTIIQIPVGHCHLDVEKQGKQPSLALKQYNKNLGAKTEKNKKRAKPFGKEKKV